MVWVRRRTLWGREKKKGKTTAPFFSGNKVLLETQSADAPWVDRARAGAYSSWAAQL